MKKKAAFYRGLLIMPASDQVLEGWTAVLALYPSPGHFPQSGALMVSWASYVQLMTILAQLDPEGLDHVLAVYN